MVAKFKKWGLKTITKNAARGVSDKLYCRSWTNLTDTEVKRVLDVIKRMEKNGWVADSVVEYDMISDKHSSIIWSYKVLK